MKIPYDALYKQVDFQNRPFNYSRDYFIWRTSKLKQSITRYIKKKDGLILDVGGGFGVTVAFLPQFVDKNNYINLDISVEMLKYSPYQNILAAAEQIPFCDASYDYVIMSESLEHVSNKTLSLMECFRILKRGGLLLLTTPRTQWIESFRRSPFIIFMVADWILNAVLRKLSRKRVEHNISGIVDSPSDEKTLANMLVGIGFVIVAQYREDNHVPWGKSGENPFWRWFADHVVDPRKFGHCTVVICQKQ